LVGFHQPPIRKIMEAIQGVNPDVIIIKLEGKEEARELKYLIEKALETGHPEESGFINTRVEIQESK